jgi:sugar/nucleoside kinase (ribokinase family)
MVDVTSVGGAAFDVFVRAPHSVGDGEGAMKLIQFPLGAKIKVESVIQSCGGGATNTSVGFSRLGMKARFCGVIGDDEWGKNIQKHLEEEGVDTSAAVIVEGEISSFSIILVDSESGQRTVLYSPNVNAHMCDPIFPRDVMKRSAWMFLNHLSDVSMVILDDCLALIRKPGGLGFAWNPGGTQIREGFDAPVVADLLRHTDILFLNAEEAMLFTKTTSILDALRAGSDAGASLMCVTDGRNGAYLSDGATVWCSKAAPDVKVVDATGAGDGFAVGVTWAIHNKINLPDALRAGTLNAASVIGMVGTQAGLLTDTELRTRLSQTTLTVTASSL